MYSPLDNSSRESHKDSISQILRAFGAGEAYFEKNTKCIQKVEDEVNNHTDAEDSEEIIRQDKLLNEIQMITRSLAGRENIGN